MYSFSNHARQTIQSKGFDPRAVLAAAQTPGVIYDNGRFPGQKRHIRDGIVAVVDPTREVIITVYANVVETEQRADQKDADAVKHFANRARREQQHREHQARYRAFTMQQKGRK